MIKINRRDFMRDCLSASFLVSINPLVKAKANEKNKYKIIEKSSKSFPLLEIKGDYYEVGYAIGSGFKKNFSAVLERRKEWFNDLKRYTDKDKDQLLEKMMRSTEEHLPHLIKELKGMADGSGIDFKDLFILNSQSEIESAMKSNKAETPGCSTFHLVNNTRKLIIHNEDGSSAYSGLMFMIKATVPSGATFISLVYPGIIAGNTPGINNYGIGQTTNYIASQKCKPGIPRYFLGRAVFEAKSIDEVIKIVSHPARSFAFHHNIVSFNENRLLSIEVTPDIYKIHETKDLYYHTNHLILDGTRDLPQDMEYVNSSSMSRFKVISRNVKNLPDINKITEEDLVKILSSHEGAPYSPCRHPEGEVQGITLATAVIDVNGRILKIYKGNPCTASRDNRTTIYSLD